jgi:hypothetical protein
VEAEEDGGMEAGNGMQPLRATGEGRRVGQGGAGGRSSSRVMIGGRKSSEAEREEMI